MGPCRKSLAFLLGIFVVIAGASGSSIPDGVKPAQLRLSWSSSPTNTMTVVWQTALPTESSVVEFGTNENLGGRSTGKRVTYAYETGIIHEVTLEGLKPGTRYFYRAGDPVAGFSPISSFVTAPSSQRDFVFTAFGDHGVGDTSKANVDLVLAEKPAFHLILGDLSYANGKQSIWDDWFTQVEPLTRTIPLMPALGNHENERIEGRRIGYIAYLARLALPPPETYYSFDYAGARFVSFNSDDFRNEAQMAWFVETLRKTREDKNINWLIVYQHHPLYSSNVGRLDNKPLIEAVRNILDEYKVDLVLAGHNHNYERSYPLTGESVQQSESRRYRKGDGVVFVISGGGGKSLYNFVRVTPDKTARRKSVPHYLRVRVSKKTLRVQAILTESRSLIDDFIIQAVN